MATVVDHDDHDRGPPLEGLRLRGSSNSLGHIERQHLLYRKLGAKTARQQQTEDEPLQRFHHFLLRLWNTAGPVNYSREMRGSGQAGEYRRRESDFSVMRKNLLRDFVFTVFFVCVPAASAQTLTYSLLPTGATAPSSRFDGAIAYDPAGRQIFLFAGQDSSPRNDLWAYS